MAQHYRHSWPARIAIAALFLGLGIASVMLWRQMQTSEQEHIREVVRYEATNLASQLEHGLHDQAQGLLRVANLWNQLGRLPEQQWRLDNQFSLDNFQGYQAIQWLGPDLHMRWILPLAGNEAAINFVLTPDHPNYPLAMLAKSTGKARFSNSFALVQGGRGFVLYTPLQIMDEQQKPVFDGFLQAVFRVENLMDNLLKNIDKNKFSVYLEEFDKPIYSREQSITVASLQQKIPLHLINNQNYSLRLRPSAQWVATLSSNLPTFVLVAGLTISTLFTAALGLALSNRRRARELKAGNKRLNAEVTRREQVEQVLRSSSERLQLVLDLTGSSKDGLFIIDPQNRDILYMNPATYSALGYSEQGFIKLFKDKPEQVIRDYAQWIANVRKAQTSEHSSIFQQYMRRFDGSFQAAEISAQLVNVSGHEYLIGVSRDNSERLKLEQQLQTLSQLDGLTGLFNRRYFDNQLGGEWRRLRREHLPLTLMMIDIDYFKAYNDQLGHLAGDDALRRIAELLKSCLQREGDTACRYGGEEFAIILPNTPAEGGRHLAERIHAKLAELQLEHPGSPLERLTVSIGIACVQANETELPDDLIARSDKALYQAKHQGRNQTCVWRQP